MSERPRLALGSNMGFTRLHCRKCKSETIHRMQDCVHCGTTASVERREKSKWQYKDSLQLRRSRA